MRRGWKQWKEPEAREVLAAWQRSGLSAAALCAREGYSETRLLRYWQDRLAVLSRSQPSSVPFVPVALDDVRRVQQIEIERGRVVVRGREDLALMKPDTGWKKYYQTRLLERMLSENLPYQVFLADAGRLQAPHRTSATFRLPQRRRHHTLTVSASRIS